MDLDHLFKLVVAARDEGEDTNTDGPAFDALVEYLDELRPNLEAGLYCERCPECRRRDRVERADRVGLTAEQAGCRWSCERCNLVFGRPHD